MPFNTVSYFAGVGTVVVAVGVGFGGALVMTGSGDKYEPPNRVERVAGSPPLHAAPAPQRSIPLGTTTASDTESTAAVSAPPNTSPPQPNTSPPQPPPDPQRAAAEPGQTTGEGHADAPRQVQQSAAKPPDQDAEARKQDAESKRQDADARRQDADARKVVERKQAERRRWSWRRQQQQQHRQDDLDNAVTEVRRIDRPDQGRDRTDRPDAGRDVVVGQHDLFEMPRMSFFGQ
jgi:hypothetical protein